MKKNALVIGGTSGLGRELAKMLSDTHNVIITGRVNPEIENLEFRNLFLHYSVEGFYADFISDLPEIDILVYSAGFYQEGHLKDLSPDQMRLMLKVGLEAPIMLLHFLLNKQETLPCFVAVTSTSGFTPRPLEPIYTAVKAGLAMLAESIAGDDIKKVLVVAPGGMKTDFWKDTGVYQDNMLEPKWVAENIMVHLELNSPYVFKFVKILRNPPKVEMVRIRFK